MLRRIGIGAREKNAELRVLRAARPDLLAIDHPFVTIKFGTCAQAGQVASRFGFAEQLTPHLFTCQQGRDVTPLLIIRAGEDDGRPRPANPDRVRRTRHSGAGEFVVDDQLVNRIRPETPRHREVRGDIARVGELPP